MKSKKSKRDPLLDLQVENGKFTRIVNPILENLIKVPFKGSELAVVLFIIRKTYGFQKTEDQISLSQFVLALNKSKQTVVSALNNLQSANIVNLLKKGNSLRSSNLWKFNKYFETWKLGDLSRLVKNKKITSLDVDAQPVNTSRHTKEKITKEILLQKKKEEEEEDFFLKKGNRKESQELQLKVQSPGVIDPAELPAILELPSDGVELVRAFIGIGCNIMKGFANTVSSAYIKYDIDSFSEMATHISTMNSYSKNTNGIFKACCENYVSQEEKLTAKVDALPYNYKNKGGYKSKLESIIEFREMQEDRRENQDWSKVIENEEERPTKEEWEIRFMTAEEIDAHFAALEDNDFDERTYTYLTDSEALEIAKNGRIRHNRRILFG